MIQITIGKATQKLMIRGMNWSSHDNEVIPMKLARRVKPSDGHVIIVVCRGRSTDLSEPSLQSWIVRKEKGAVAHDYFLAERLALPRGQGVVVGVEIARLMPVGSGDLFGFLFVSHLL